MRRGPCSHGAESAREARPIAGRRGFPRVASVAILATTLLAILVVPCSVLKRGAALPVQGGTRSLFLLGRRLLLRCLTGGRRRRVFLRVGGGLLGAGGGGLLRAGS